MDKSEQKKIFSGIFDEKTIKVLYNLARKHNIKEFTRVVKSGKESTVILGRQNEKNIAVKVYALDAGNFKTIKKYIIGDRRFSKIKPTRTNIVFAWCQKEYKNLKIAEEIGVSSPKVIDFSKNVLLMEFLGENDEAYPRLSDVKIENPIIIFNNIVKDMIKLSKYGLVHGDLSEYNVLVNKNEYFIIDFSQGVLKTHPLYNELLERDIKNMINWGIKRKIKIEKEKIYEKFISSSSSIS